MATTSLIYLVTNTEGTNRLVRATVASQAITHAAKQSFTARVASQDDIVKAMEQGIRVETYGESAQPSLDIE